METKERINAAYAYLKKIGRVASQQSIADRMGVRKESVSKAFNGNRSYLTHSFILRFNNAFGNPFNTDWIESGEGEMLCGKQSVGNISDSSVTGVNVSGSNIHINPSAYDVLLRIVENNQKAIEKFQEQMDRLITLLEKKYGQ